MQVHLHWSWLPPPPPLCKWLDTCIGPASRPPPQSASASWCLDACSHLSYCKWPTISGTTNGLPSQVLQMAYHLRYCKWPTISGTANGLPSQVLQMAYHLRYCKWPTISKKQQYLNKIAISKKIAISQTNSNIANKIAIISNGGGVLKSASGQGF